MHIPLVSHVFANTTRARTLTYTIRMQLELYSQAYAFLHNITQIFTVSALENPYRVILTGKNETDELVRCSAYMVPSSGRLLVGKKVMQYTLYR